MESAKGEQQQWDALIDASKQRYSPCPTKAKICIHIPDPKKELSKEARERILLAERARITLIHSLVHDIDSPFVVDVYLKQKRKSTSESNFVTNPSIQGAMQKKAKTLLSTTDDDAVIVPKESTQEVEVQVEYDISKIEFTRLPLLLTGFYLKRSRELSQTPMFVNGGRKRIGVSSVQELICEPIIREFFQTKEEAEKCEPSFAGAGREDVDVQVFGPKGRQFILTIPNPTRTVDDSELFRELEDRIRSTSKDLVRVRDLKPATIEDRKQVLEGAEQRRKLYVCVVELETPLDSEEALQAVHNLTELRIQQKTPIRVAHRRAMMTRERFVHHTRAAYISPTMFVLWLEAGAGFYIKEFVHGDLGRTSPSISELLGTNARLVTLDFLGSSSDIKDDGRMENAEQVNPLDGISAEWFW